MADTRVDTVARQLRAAKSVCGDAGWLQIDESARDIWRRQARRLLAKDEPPATPVEAGRD